MLKKNTSIRCLEIFDVSIEVDYDTFKNVISKYESLIVHDRYNLSSPQMRALYQKMSEKNDMTNCLKTMILKGGLLHNIDPTVMAKCFFQLEELEMDGDSINVNQTKALVYYSGGTNNLKKHLMDSGIYAT